MFQVHHSGNTLDVPPIFLRLSSNYASLALLSELSFDFFFLPFEAFAEIIGPPVMPPNTAAMVCVVVDRMHMRTDFKSLIADPSTSSSLIVLLSAIEEAVVLIVLLLMVVVIMSSFCCFFINGRSNNISSS